MRLFGRKKKGDEHRPGREARTTPDTEHRSDLTREMRDREADSNRRASVEQGIGELQKRRGFQAADIAEQHAEVEPSADAHRTRATGERERPAGEMHE